jgi:hypothetical protein
MPPKSTVGIMMADILLKTTPERWADIKEGKMNEKTCLERSLKRSRWTRTILRILTRWSMVPFMTSCP